MSVSLQFLLVVFFFSSIGVELDVTHFNALLTAYVENDHKFSPLELVEEMRQKEIGPNVVSDMER